MKKFLVSTIIFSMILFCLSYISFAANLTNDTKNTMNNIGNAVSNTSNNAKNTIQNVENKVENGAMDTRNTVTGAIRNVENGIEDIANDTMMGKTENTDDNYTATRTASNNGFLGMSSTNWTWVILAIVGIAIVALVWYYGSQYEHTDYSDGE